jgi:hypothetical protein
VSRQRAASSTPRSGSAPDVHGSTAEPLLRRSSRHVGPLAFTLWLCGAASCAPSAAPTAAALPIVATPITPAPAAPPEPLMPDGTPALDAKLVERVPEGTFGPYVGTAPDGRAVALWAALAENAGWRWFSSALDPKGGPSKPRALAEAPGELSLAAVRPVGAGFVALAAGVTPSGTRVEALRLGPSGELLSGPTPLDLSRTEVLWLEALRAGEAEVALWATLAVGAADLALVPLGADGTQRATPVMVLENLKAWQAVEFGDSVAIAALTSGSNENARSLLVAFVDGEGHTLHQTVIRSGARIEDHIDAARIGDNLVVAWTERDGVDARLWLAALGPDTRLLAAPAPAAAPLGRQRLVDLLPAGEPRGMGLLAWEHGGQAPRGQRRIELGRVNERARLEPSAARLSVADLGDEQPELVRKGRGVAVLTRAVLCERATTPCATPDPVPAFAELGAELEPLASEPIRLAPEAGKTADLAWGLHCSAESCSALAALPAAPVPIYGVELRPRSPGWTPIASLMPLVAPRAAESRAVAETPPLADVVAARVGSGWLLGTLSQFDDTTPYVKPKTPAPDGKLAPVRAVLTLQPFALDGRAEPARVISYRARASSGIALARLSDDRALLAWSALDQQRPEVFATLVGKDGQPAMQRMLTSNAGDIGGVAAAPLDKGSVVAWIGNREGEPRLFAARLNDALLRTAPEQRLSAESGFTGISMVRRGNEAWLAATRQDERQGVLSITRLDPKTAARKGTEIVIGRSETRAYASPALATRGDRALLGWVERPLMGGGEAPRALLLELDAEGRAIGEPIAVSSSTGDPSAVRLYCDGARCQGAIDARPPDGALLEGFEWDASSPPRAEPLVFRGSAAADAPAFVLTDGAIFHADRAERRGVLRRLSVTWR